MLPGAGCPCSGAPEARRQAVGRAVPGAGAWKEELMRATWSGPGVAGRREGKEAQQRQQTCTTVADSRCCTAEIQRNIVKQFSSSQKLKIKKKRLPTELAAPRQADFKENQPREGRRHMSPQIPGRRRQASNPAARKGHPHGAVPGLTIRKGGVS